MLIHSQKWLFIAPNYDVVNEIWKVRGIHSNAPDSAKNKTAKRQLTGKPLRLQGGFLYVCAKEYTKFEAAGVLFHAFQVFVKIAVG